MQTTWCFRQKKFILNFIHIPVLRWLSSLVLVGVAPLSVGGEPLVDLGELPPEPSSPPPLEF